MRTISRPACMAVGIAVTLALAAPPVAAQTMADLDRLSDITENEQSGIDAAVELGNGGAYLEALATLERVMALNPRSVTARLLHAVYLCRIDDRQGGLVEISQMDEDDFGAENLADARNRCNSPNVVEAPPVSAPAPAPLPAPVGNTNSLSGSNSVSSGSSGSRSSSSAATPAPAADGGEKD